MTTELCYTTPVFVCMLFLFLCFVFISADAGMEAWNGMCHLREGYSFQAFLYLA